MARLSFGVFELDPAGPVLRRRGVPVPLPTQSLRLLVHLAERAGQTVTRDELRRLLWPDGTHVEFEGSLNFAVSRLRRALGDRAEAPLFVETLPRVGYRFVAPVTRIEPGVPVPPAAGRAWRMALAAALLLTVLPWAPPRALVSAAPPAQVEAAYRAGLYGLRDAGRLAAGTRSLERVVGEAPGFGPAWAALAESWLQQAELGMEAPAVAMPRARRAALTAADLGEADRAGLVLAAVSLHHDRDLAAARRWLDTSRLDSARALLLDAELQFLEGQPEAALRSARRAEELDPVCPVVQGQLAELLYLSRRFPEAAAAWERAAQVAPDLVGPRVRLFHAWRQAGNPAAARRAALEVLRLLGRTDDLPEDYTAFLRGNLAHLQAEAQRQPAVVADRIAVLHAALGEDEEARAWLERARTERSPGLALTLAADPDLDRLRSRADFPRSLTARSHPGPQLTDGSALQLSPRSRWRWPAAASSLCRGGAAVTKRWLAIAMLCSGCGGGGAASAPTVAAISVGGQYETAVTLQESSCAGITVMSLPTTVTHAAGATSLSLTHAGTTYPGALQADGRFATDPLLVSGSLVRIEGRFTTTGLDATVTVDVQVSAPCRYVTRWAGTKQGPPNVLP